MIEERFIAIDNVCAWPNLTLLPNGEVIAAVFNQPTHAGWEGHVECWASVDQGRSWTLRGIPKPHDPKTNRMNQAAGLARDGSMIVMVSGWSNRNPPGKYSCATQGEVLPICVCRSEDSGKSWQTSEVFSNTSSLIPFGDIIHLPDKQLGVCIYHADRSDPEECNSNFYVSNDDGKTWSMQGLIGKGFNETAPVSLENGKILAVARSRAEHPRLELMTSEDNGKQWTSEGPLTLEDQIPGHLVMLKNQQLLLTYGIRNIGSLYGIGAKVSKDMGKTWSEPVVLVDFETSIDGGYPSSVQFDDGTILTAYYSNEVPCHTKYHMGCIRWKLD